MGREHLVRRPQRPPVPAPPRRQHLCRRSARTPRTIVAFRTDAVYLTQPHNWPYHGQPGDYLHKGQLNGPIPAPTSEDELLALRDAGRAAPPVRTTWQA